MYAIKVETGTERIAVRQYSSSFTLTYTSAAENSMGRKMLVAPGYIFTRKIVGNNVIKIPDKDWKVLDAISDPHPSTLDVKTQQIIDGPLKGLLILQINPSLKSVCIRARILDEVRDYWLAVRFTTAQSSTTPDTTQLEDKEKATKPKRLEKETKKMAKYTEEQLENALARAAEVGIHKAAAEGGIPWQALQAYAKKLGRLEEVSLKKKAVGKAAPAAAPEKKAPTKKAEPKTTTKGKKKAPATPVVEEKAVSEQTAPTAPATTVEEKKKPKAVSAPAEEKKAVSIPVEDIEPATSALAIENAVLKKENEQLKAQVEKLKKALAELI